MSTSFPTGLDTYTDVATGGTILAATTNNVQDSIEALEIKLGINTSAVVTSLDYLVTNASSTDPGHLHTTSGISGQVAVAQGGTGSSTASAARTALGVAIGSDVQAYDADLTELAGLADADGNFIVGSASGWVAESGATARTSIGLGSVENTALSTWAGTTNVTTLGTIATGVWNGTAIANANMANSSVNYGGVTLALGASDTTPAFDLSDATAYVGDSSLVTLGTVGTGTWNGTAVADEYGGTGQTTYAAGDILYASGVDTLTKLTAGTDTHVLTLASGLPSWAAAGSSSAFTDAVTITLTSASDGLTIDQSGAGLIADLKGSTVSRFNIDTEGKIINEVTATAGDGFIINMTRPGGLGNIDFLDVRDGGTSRFKVGIGSNFYLYSGALHQFSSGLIDSRDNTWALKDLGQGNSYLHFYKTSLSGIVSFGINIEAAEINLGGSSGSNGSLELINGYLKAATGDETMLDFSGTVNKATSGNYTGLKFNVTEMSAPGSGNLLLDLQVGGTAKFTVGNEGIVNYNGTMGNSSKNPTTDAPADWVQVEIGGTAYYIPAYAVS